LTTGFLDVLGSDWAKLVSILVAGLRYTIRTRT
jgi:hypothetical protein